MIMPEYHFTLVLDRAPAVDEGPVAELMNGECKDARFGVRDGVAFAEFSRGASCFVSALRSAMAAVQGAGLRILRVEPDELVTLSDIARRTDRSRESVRLLMTGKRGDGTFPVPVARHSDRHRLWRWSDVAVYFSMAPPPEAQIVAAVNARLELSRLDLHAREQADLIVSEQMTPSDRRLPSSL